jgi:hypothetical protein
VRSIRRSTAVPGSRRIRRCWLGRGPPAAIGSRPLGDEHRVYQYLAQGVWRRRADSVQNPTALVSSALGRVCLDRLSGRRGSRLLGEPGEKCRGAREAAVEFGAAGPQAPRLDPEQVSIGLDGQSPSSATARPSRNCSRNAGRSSLPTIAHPQAPAPPGRRLFVNLRRPAFPRSAGGAWRDRPA